MPSKSVSTTWEPIDEQRDPNTGFLLTQTERLMIARGWLYRTIVFCDSGESTLVSTAMVWVPDPE